MSVCSYRRARARTCCRIGIRSWWWTCPLRRSAPRWPECSASPNRCTPWNVTSARWPRRWRISGQSSQLRRCPRKGRSWSARPMARGSRCAVAPKHPRASSPRPRGRCAPTPRKWPCSGRPIRWIRSCAHPKRSWMPCFKTPPLVSRRPHAPGPASSTYGPPCSAMPWTRPRLRCKRSSVGWPSRWRNAIPTG